PPLRCTLFPYTTLFRSCSAGRSCPRAKAGIGSSPTATRLTVFGSCSERVVGRALFDSCRFFSITKSIVSEVPPARLRPRQEPSRHFGYNLLTEPWGRPRLWGFNRRRGPRDEFCEVTSRLSAGRMACSTDSGGSYSSPAPRHALLRTVKRRLGNGES